MNEYSKKLEELKSLMGYTDTSSLARKEELFHWFENNGMGKENHQLLDEFIRNGINGQRKGIETLRVELDQEPRSLFPCHILQESILAKAASGFINASTARKSVAAHTPSTTNRKHFQPCVARNSITTEQRKAGIN